jgi:hypothetical protein
MTMHLGAAYGAAEAAPFQDRMSTEPSRLIYGVGIVPRAKAHLQKGLLRGAEAPLSHRKPFDGPFMRWLGFVDIVVVVGA